MKNELTPQDHAALDALMATGKKFTLMRREYSWALELETRPGYKSCGVTIALAVEHALGGAAEAETRKLDAMAFMGRKIGEAVTA